MSLTPGAAAVGGGKCGGAALRVPRYFAILCGRADGQGVDTVGVAITVTAVMVTPTITGRPHEDGAEVVPTLKWEKRNLNIWRVIIYSSH